MSQEDPDGDDAYNAPARGRAIWARDTQELLDRLTRHFTDLDRGAPWVELWLEVITLATHGPAGHPEEAAAFHEAISNALAAVDLDPVNERGTELKNALETVFPQIVETYIKVGREADVADVRHRFQSAQFYTRYGDFTFHRVEGLTDALRLEMGMIKDGERRAELILKEANAAVALANDAAKKAEDAATAAGVAAGQAGTNALADEFHTFAEDHKTASAGYRFWTITVLVVAVCVAVLFVLGLDRILLQAIGAPGATANTSTDPAVISATEGQRWQAVVYRLAILGGLAGLSAYLGRQAALHRRLHDWGRAVEAQARSFEAFAKQITDPDTKNQVQLLFSNRVLGSPPEPTAEKTVARDALQIVADAAMKSRGASS